MSRLGVKATNSKAKAREVKAKAKVKAFTSITVTLYYPGRRGLRQTNFNEC